VESIFLSVEGGDFEAFPVSLSLLPYTAGHLLALSGVPRAAGTVSCLFFSVLDYMSEYLSFKNMLACNASLLERLVV
jgi:hypothetical protein